MTQTKETKQAAFKAWGTVEAEIIKELSMLIKEYEKATEEKATKKVFNKIFKKIHDVCLIVVMKGMNQNPLDIIKQLDEIEKAVNIVKPNKS